MLPKFGSELSQRTGTGLWTDRTTCLYLYYAFSFACHPQLSAIMASPQASMTDLERDTADQAHMPDKEPPQTASTLLRIIFCALVFVLAVGLGISVGYTQRTAEFNPTHPLRPPINNRTVMCSHWSYLDTYSCCLLSDHPCHRSHCNRCHSGDYDIRLVIYEWYSLRFITKPTKFVLSRSQPKFNRRHLFWYVRLFAISSRMIHLEAWT